jgi:hypothetical protein
MQFLATCSKWNKKLTLTLSAGDLDAARGMLHAQGYSIIEIRENTAVTETWWNFFYFDALVWGIPQSGKIQSTDIFKSYKKLTEDLKYDVVYIYTNDNMPEEAKKVITAKVKDGYRLYKQSIWEDMDLENDLKSKTEDQQDMQEISGEVLKEIEKYGIIIDTSIEKIQNLFLKYHDTITPDQKQKLEYLENTLVQSKSTKNIWKISMTVEGWLRTIGEIELSLLKIGMTEEKKKFLAETNALLKQVGSKDRLQTESEKENTLNFKMNALFSKITTTTDKVEKNKKDTNSFIYFKNKRELDIYKKKLNTTEVEILKAFFTFQITQIKKLFLKRKLIAQNIEIIDNRINNRIVSYTKIIHGIEYHIKNLFLFFEHITSILFYTLFFFTLAYIGFDILAQLGFQMSHIQGKSILFVTIFSITTLLFLYTRTILTSIITLPLLIWIVYFLSINF